MGLESYKYRCIKESSWGIAIDFSFRVEYVKEGDNLASDLCLSVKFNKNVFLSYEFKEIIRKGIAWVGPLILSRKKVIIYVEKINFNPTDFQKEGLFFGVASWASEFFEFQLPDYETNFDRINNRYVFHIPDASDMPDRSDMPPT